MIFKTQQNVAWLEFEKLSCFSFLKHAIFLRNTSSLNWESLPYFTHHSAKKAKQVHGHQVHLVHSSYLEQEGDGLMTELPYHALVMRHADCQATIFYDPVNHAVANVHAGWRGLTLNIYQETIIQMKKTFASNPSDLIVCIGPSLGPKYSEFVNYQTEFPSSFYPFQYKPFYFNLWAIAKDQLLKEGVREENIEIAELCTYTHSSYFFSYRRDKTMSRHDTIVSLLPRI
ncbi:MAG: peptidoglycan editing factor PgeF [Rhabdochlamydiaceae bacterium]